MEYHEFANIFPLDEEGLHDLADDIAKHGLLHPIEIFEGKILDGRRRSAACVLAGVKPSYQEVDPSDAVAHVISLNLYRRHLTESQRAMVGARAREIYDREAKDRQKASGGDRKSKKSVPVNLPEPIKGDARDVVGKAVGVSGKSIDYATKLLKQAPDLVKKVEAGKMKVSQANLELNRRKKREVLKKAEAQAIETSWRIINEDCLNAFDEETPGSVRLIIADPPYNIGVDYGRGAAADKLPERDYLAWCDDWIERCFETLTPDGSLWVIISDEFAAEMAVALKAYGFHRRSWIKWYETFGVNCANNFNRCTRHIFYCVKNPKKFVFHDDAVRTPSARQTVYNDKRANPAGKIWDDLWQIPRLTGTCDERIPDFPTQLPLDLVRPIVRCASDPGDTVLDPFCGSGTTGVAAIEARRHFIGFEWEEKFCELANLRLKGTAHDLQETPPTKTR